MSVQILTGDALTMLGTLESESVQVCVTSPPYYGLRDYGVDGQVGLERTPLAFLETLWAIFDEVRRVLRPDGLCFVNIGDSYAGSGKGPTGHNGIGDQEERQGFVGGSANSTPNTARLPAKADGYKVPFRTGGGYIGHQQPSVPGIPAKNLLLIPQRFAIGMQDRGWWVRSEIAWAKTSAMPECLDPETKVFIKGRTGHISRMTLGVIHKGWGSSPFPPEILTPTGWKRIKHIWGTTKHERVHFDAARVSSVICSPEHRWPISHDRRRIATHEVEARELRDDGYRDYLMHHAIDEWLDGNTTQMWGQTLDYDLGWLLGIYAAEGGFGEVRGHRCKLTMHKDEGPILDRAQEIIERKFGAKVSRRQIKNYESMRFSSELWRRCASYVVSGKSTDKVVNLELLLNAPREFRLGLWDGYIVGDGSGRKGGGVIATSASRALRDSMAVVASSIGLITSKGDYVRRDPRTRKDYSAYSLWTPYATYRKAKKESTARQLTIRNKEIEPLGVRSVGWPMIDIEVEGGLFLIDDGLVTHNSVRDRPTSAWEPIWMFSKAAKYFYDADAVRQPAALRTLTETRPARSAPPGYSGNPNVNGVAGYPMPTPEGGANIRNVWTLSPEPNNLAHFASFPTEIPRRCILAGTSEKGCCPRCRAPWVRLVERGGMTGKEKAKIAGFAGYAEAHSQYPQGSQGLHYAGRTHRGETRPAHTLGWAPSCQCDAGPPTPCLVLDPFLGSGTTLLVASRLGRDGVGIELNSDYVSMAEKRLESDAPLLAEAVEVRPPLPTASQPSMFSGTEVAG